MRFVVFGGGCYGTFYARQLLRAREAGALAVDEVLVVDREAEPRARREVDAGGVLRFSRMEWGAFLRGYLPALDADAEDVLVPPPFTPHLALVWILERLRAERPELGWRLEPFRALPDTPYRRQADGGPLAVSHADWICPVHCIEPETCPKTRGPRHWDLERTAHDLAGSLDRAGQPVDQVHLFLCHHIAYGVGGYRAARVVEAYRAMRDASMRDASGRDASGRSRSRFLVGTVSHCHGALHLLAAVPGTFSEARRESAP